MATKIHHSFKRTVATSAITIVGIIGIGYLLAPDKGGKALSFVGSGKIIESESQVIGTSSQYWAIIACDPKEVREFIKAKAYPSDSSGLNRLQDRFSDGYRKWPSNFDEYSTDLLSFEVRRNRWIIVAFNDTAAEEVLYLKWSD